MQAFSSILFCPCIIFGDPPAMSQEVTAVLSKVIFQSPRADFLVAEFIDVQSAKRFRASGKIQISPKADSKARYRLIGEWENNAKYGETFVSIYCEATRPLEVKGIAPYLANQVKGVGDVTAKKLIQSLNVTSIEDLVNICKTEKEKIFSFFGEKKAKIAENIVQIMTTDEVFRSIMIFLHEHNIPPRFAKKIYDKYAAESISNLMENPYRLISDFRQVGFLRADAIAQKLGIPSTSRFRIEAAFVYALEVGQDEGNVCLPRNVLVDKACVLLGSKNDPTFSSEFVLGELRQIYKQNKETEKETFLIRDTSQYSKITRSETLFYLPENLKMEDEVAGFILSLLNLPLTKEFKEIQILKQIESKEKTFEEIFPTVPWKSLSDEQSQAVKMSLNSRLMVLTGGPGCGKTFVLKAIYSIQRNLNRRVALCAPTGLAAKRMSASIGETASTLHKLLGIGRKKDQEITDVIDELEGNSDSLSNVDVVIVDECSMLNLELFHLLLHSLGPNKRLILVGDADQLPSIGHGNCLRDMIASNRVPLARLTHIFRQSSQSPIPIAAREIISGRKPQYSAVSYTHALPKPEPMAFISCSTETFFDSLLPFLNETVKNIYGLDPVRDCQILVPMRKTIVGLDNINKILQENLNPSNSNKAEYTLPYGGILRCGDKVIQTKNNYDLNVFNGDLGYCKSIKKEKDKTEVMVEFSDKTITFEDEQIDDLQLCYAMTVHKSQGSEFPLCIIPMFGVYYSMLDRNLLYTAITRASRFVIVFGEDWAVKKAIGSQNAIKRFSFLETLLQS
jgi:exodeoxyribonuclease V alpha subunit